MGKQLTIIVANDRANIDALQHQGEWRPFDRKTIAIELTPRQCQLLELGDNDHIERIFIEEAPDA